MTKYTRVIILFFMCILLGAALFAEETGEISGKVTDEEGMGLPGVNITATGAGLQGKRVVLSGNDGSFRLPILPIGIYKLIFEIQGFATLTQENVRVKLGMTTSLTVGMKVAPIEEQLTVVAQTPLIDKTKADTSFNVTTKELANAPIQGRTIYEIMNFTPGVTGVRHDTNWGVGGGGTDYGTGSFRGEGASGNNFLVDGLTKRGADANSSGVKVNYDSWEEVQIISDGFSPEMGSTYGGTINIVTKSGGNTFHGELGSLIWDKGLRADRVKQLAIAIEPVTSQYNFFGNIGGPIVKDKLWFFVSDNVWRKAENLDASSIGWLQIPEGKKRFNTNNFFGKVTFSPIQNHTLSLSGTYDSFLSQSGGFGLPELYTKDDYKDYAYRLNYKGIFGANTLVEMAIGRSSRDSSQAPLSDDMDTVGIGYSDIGQSTTNVWGKYNNQDKRTDFTSRFTQYINTEKFGNHELGLGFLYYSLYRGQEIDHTGKAWLLWPTDYWNGGTWMDYAAPGVPYQMRQFRNQMYHNKGKGYGLYFKDRVTFDHFTVMLGVRSETQRVYDDFDVQVFDWGLGDFISPRFSIAWDVTGDGVNVLKLGAGMFTDTVLYDVMSYFTKGGGSTFVVYNWIGPVPTYPEDEAVLRNVDNWEYSWQQGGPGTVGEYGIVIGQGVKPDKMYKLNLEYNRQIGPDWAVKVRGIFTRRQDMLEDLGFFDYKGFWYELRNWKLKKRNYLGFELEVNGRIADKLFLNASYVRSAAKGTTAGDYETYGNYAGTVYNTVGCFGDHFSGPADSDWSFFDPLTIGMGGWEHGDEGWYGYLPYSCDNAVKILGTYMAPYGITISSSFELYAGYHWSIWGFQPGYGVYLTFPHGRGTETVPTHTYVDLSVQKDFKLVSGLNLGFRLNVTNLFNSQRPISYGSGEGSPLFRQVWGRQFPRWLQFQVFLRF